MLGWKPVVYVEKEPYCQDIIKARIRDGIFTDAPIHDDVDTFDAKPYRGKVDIVTGGFPCQSFSVAGKRLAQNDERNKWPETIRIIREAEPEWAFLENVNGLLAGSHGYFGVILSDLLKSGYAVRWHVIGASHVGAPHRRLRLWIVAKKGGWEARLTNKAVPFASLNNKQWITQQVDLFTESQPFKESWPRAGEVGLDQIAHFHPHLGKDEELCATFPTPTASSYGYGKGGAGGRVGPIRPSLEMMARKSLWPTPSASDGEGSRTLPEGTTTTGLRPDGKKAFVGLNNAVKRSLLPRLSFFEVPSPQRAKPAHGRDYPWPTPTAQDASSSARANYNGVGNAGTTLTDAVRSQPWPTPTTRDYKDGTAKSCQNTPVNGLLGREIHERKDVDTIEGGLLHPDFHCWLLGWPIGSTSTEPMGREWDQWTDLFSTHSWWKAERSPRLTTIRKGRRQMLRASGNGQVPLCVVAAWVMLS